MAFCGECGFEINSNDKFCRNCGNKYDIETILVESKAPDNTEQQATEEVAEQNNDVVEASEKNNFERDIPDKKSAIDADYFNKKNITITISIIVILLITTILYPYIQVLSVNVESIEPYTEENKGVGFSPGSEDLLAILSHDMRPLSLEYSIEKFDFTYDYQIYAKSLGSHPYSELNLVLEETCKYSIESECKIQLVPMQYNGCWVPIYSPMAIEGGLGGDAYLAMCGMDPWDSDPDAAIFYRQSTFGIIENNFNFYDSGSEEGLPLYFELMIQFSVETSMIVPSPPTNGASVTIQIDMLDYDNDLINDYDDSCPEEYAQTSNGCP